MTLPSLNVLGGVLVTSEFLLALRKRAGRDGGKKDRFTLQLLWLVIGLSIWAAFEVQARCPSGRLPYALTFYLTGLTLFVVGLIIRWVAIIQLGRFFTVNVSIAEDHRLVTTGLYRFVRHPSYTGVLLIFLGFGLCLLNWYSLLVLLVPISFAFLWRIRVEETALRGAFGESYRAYSARTPRVIPWLY